MSGRGTHPAAERHESGPCGVALFLIMTQLRLRILTGLGDGHKPPASRALEVIRSTRVEGSLRR